ncbi:T9SS type A sorting domain-containing protein, partial [uncultured Polaribacter sp.]
KTFQVNFKTGEINISDLQTGMYFLSLKGKNGVQFSTKIFKE